jgi:multiple sugar transport system ATP-binding protein
VTDVDLRLDGISKRFAPNDEGDVRAGAPALAKLTLEARRGELVVVVGPSGCGKSTALRIVAGLETPDAGRVEIGGRDMAGVAPRDRDVAMVFQGYALYPQMTAREILEFPLKLRRVSPAERARIVRETAALLRIEPLLGRRPDQMSGGERQRVAMGRAIVRKPRIFLFDEPLSSLDAALRADMRLEIGQLLRKLGATSLYVTHDHVEAMTLADRIAVLRGGELQQVGTPRAIYETPATSFVAGFLGSPRINLLEGRVEDGELVVAGSFRVPRPSYDLPARVEVGVRPEDVHIGSEGAAGEVVAVEPLGAETHLVVKTAQQTLRAVVRGFDAHRRGDAVRVSVDANRALLFDPEAGGVRLA